MDQLAQAWKPLIVCNGPDCTFADLVLLAQNVITDLVLVATLIATAAFIFVGFKLLVSGGNPGALKDAKDALLKIVIGFAWILAAWLVVYTITSVLLKSGYSILGPPR